MAENQQYDIVFVLDESGSMRNPIKNVKDNISQFVDMLKSKGIDVQLGIVEYGAKDGEVITKHNLTDNVETFVATLDLINPQQSNWESETGLTALMDPDNGALSLNFRENSNREIIVVTDEGYVENDSQYSGIFKDKYSQSMVIEALKNNSIKLDVFGSMRDYENCKTEWEPIANATSGQLINGDTVNGQFYDIQNDFSTLFKAALIDGVPVTGTHQVSFTQWSFGYTPTDAAAALASDPNSSITITPNA